MLNWDEGRHALGVAEMDATHREFAALAGELARAGPDEFPRLFGLLVEHTQRHFDNESRLMRTCAFPAIAEHEAEHRRVLGELERLQRGLAQGRVAFARAYVQEGLAAWFDQHLATMDGALAARLRYAAQGSTAKA